MRADDGGLRAAGFPALHEATGVPQQRCGRTTQPTPSSELASIRIYDAHEQVSTAGSSGAVRRLRPTRTAPLKTFARPVQHTRYAWRAVATALEWTYRGDTLEPCSGMRDLLVLVSGAPDVPAFVIQNQSEFQGAIYVVGGFQLHNAATMHGPVIASSLDLRNNGLEAGWPEPLTLPSGVPQSASGGGGVTYVAGSWRG